MRHLSVILIMLLALIPSVARSQTITSLPTTFTFEDCTGATNTSARANQNNLPTGWSFFNNMPYNGTGNSYQGYPIIYNRQQYAHSGTNVVRFWCDKDGYEVLIFPQIDSTLYPINGIMLSLYARAQADIHRGWAEIGVMTDTADLSTFVVLDTIDCNNSTAHQRYIYYLNSYQGNGRLAVRCTRINTGLATNALYLDDITLSEIPSCPEPNNITLQQVGDSAIMQWQDYSNGNASYEVVYGYGGFDLATAGTHRIVSGDSCIVEGITAGMVYDFYLRAVCDSTERPWSTVQTLLTSTAVNMYQTGSDTLRGCGFTVYDNGGADNFYTNGCDYTYYIFPDNSSNTLRLWGFSYTQTTKAYVRVYDGIGTMGTTLYDDYGINTFTAIEPTTSITGALTVVFHSDVTGSPAAGFELHVGCVPFPACPQVANLQVSRITNRQATVSWDGHNNYIGTKLYWGTASDIAACTDSVEIYGDTTYTLTNLHGSNTYHVWATALCGDENARPSTTSFTTPCNCGEVSNLVVASSDYHAFALRWDAPTEGDSVTNYCVNYRAEGDTAWLSDTITTTYYFVSGLTPFSKYQYQITALCDSLHSVTQQGEVITNGCGIVGNGSTTNIYLPLYHLYNYSYSQQIYLASDLAGMGDTIYGISFKSNGTITINRNVDIYLGNTTQQQFASTTDAIPVSAMQLVYSDTMTVTPGWINLTFATPFVRNGSNLVVAVDDNTGGYNNYTHFAADPTTTNRSIYFFQDELNINPSAPLAAEMSVANVVNQLRFNTTCHIPDCDKPVLFIDANDADLLQLSWLPEVSNANYTLNYRLSGEHEWQLYDNAITANSYTLQGLTPGTQYDFQLTMPCGTDTLVTEITIITECAPMAIPYTETFQQQALGYFDRRCWAVGTTSPLNISANNYPSIVTLAGSDSRWLKLNQGGYVVLPSMDAPLSSLEVRFSLRQDQDNVPLLLALLADEEAPISSAQILGSIARSDYSSVNTASVVYPLDSALNESARLVLWCRNATTPSYINNITIAPISTCPMADSVAVDNITPTTAEVSWVTSSNVATSYLVEYGFRGFEQGSGTYLTTTQQSISLTALAHSSDYDLYVSTICSGDTALTSNVAQFTTPCGTITQLPYIEDFETSAAAGVTRAPLPNCWQFEMLNSNFSGSSFQPAVFTSSSPAIVTSGSHCLNLYGTSLVALPEFGVALNSLMISFNDYNGTPTSCMLVVGAADSLNDAHFEPIDTIAMTLGMNHITCPLNNYQGNAHHIVIKNFNSEGYGYSNHYIDDIVVDYLPNCMPPTDVHLTAVTTTTAALAWADSNAVAYQVEYGSAGFTQGAGNIITSTTLPISLTGLTANTTYDIYARVICTDGDTSWWSSAFSFQTLHSEPVSNYPYLCTFEDNTSDWVLQNGLQLNRWCIDTAASNNTPKALYISSDNGVSNDYIFTAASHVYAYRDLQLSAGSWQYAFDWRAMGEADYFDFLRVYLVPASITLQPGLLPDGSTNGATNYNQQPDGWIALDNGALHSSASWQTLSGYVTLPASGIYHLTFLWSNDDSRGSLPPAAIDNIMFDTFACQPVSNLVANSDFESLSLTWDGSAESYDIAIRLCNTETWLETTTSTSNSISFSHLNIGTCYTLRVRQHCGNGELSDWVEIEAFTLSITCPPPTDLHVVETTFQGATLAWTAANDEPLVAHFWGTDIEWYDTITNNTIQIADLYADMTYHFCLQSICHNGTYFSPWSDTLSFTIDRCNPVGNVVVSGVTSHSANISWTSPNNVSAWQLNYGEPDFIQANGTIVNVTTNPYTLSGLLPNSDYDLYVRSQCSATRFSDWSSRSTFHTSDGDGISEATTQHIHLYPNPTSNNVTVAWEENNAVWNVELLDLQGRVVKSLSNITTATAQLTNLTTGTYFVRIYSATHSTIKKLIVR